MRTFLLVFSAQIFSLFGSELVQFALIWWLTQASGSATTLTTAAMVGLLPPVLLGPLVGTLVDRWNRRLVMMAADGLIATATLALAALFAFGAVEVGHVFILLSIRALGTTFHWPAMQASTTLMVPERHLARVAGTAQALRGLAGVTMPALAALLLTVFPIAAILTIDVVTAVVAITPLLFVSVPQPRRDAASAIASVWTDLRSGMRFVGRRRGLTVLIALIAILHFWAAPAFALMPIVVTRTFGRGAAGLAWTQSAMGAGFLVGGLLLGLWGGFRRRVVAVLVGVALLGASMAVVGAVPRSAFWAIVAATLAAGILVPVAVGSFQAIQQALVPPEMQGRVLSLARSGMDLMSPVGMAVAGPAADAIGVQRWYLLTGAVMMLMAVAAFLIPTVMHIEEHPAGIGDAPRLMLPRGGQK